jgi:hypothetical protein
MKSFKQFIESVEYLSELFDKPTKYKTMSHKEMGLNKDESKSGRFHGYHFKHNNQSFRVGVYHHPNGHAEVDFDTGGSHDITGQHGHSSHKIFSSVHKILKDHSDKHKHLSHYKFYSDASQPSRGKLYHKLTKKMGGVTKRGEDDHEHIVPIKR